MVSGFGVLEGFSTDEVEDVIEDLRERDLLVEAGRITPGYPICWRCKTPLVFRVVDDWFISADEIRQPLLDANATVEVDTFLLLEAYGRLAATWATGTSRASGTSGCRCPSTRAPAAT